MRHTTRALAAAAVLLSATAQAAPVTFTLDAGTFLAGAGYGVDAQENGGKLLDVLFASTLSPMTFALTVNQSHSFAIGTVNLREPDTGSGSNQGINQQEQDDAELGVNASIVFIDPFGGMQSVSAAGVATRGTIGGDGDIDFGIDWQSVIVPFGNGGSFELSLGDLDFTTQGVQTQMATIKLLSGPASTEAPGQTVPEPTSLALFALAFSTLGMRRLRRAS